MVRAYVMVKAHTSEADRLLREVEAIDGVVDAAVVAGDVDLIATLSVDSPADVKAVSADSVQGIDGVEDTRTYVAME
ncbi:Lrp/AsnC family transcriptional regulator [Haloglomus irregulare]|jgi:DNA-binding Lrp family transcriptional regulator|uniref:Lrp/AsnC family transcriptional regulator n=1 Tax=Haloglomus irregulare TaxID=2234134 RepID=A0A554NGH8_9EURY|nr:Lrp/AsnC family transcriptional regulator [Haloglomus irregulare]TSD16100.1 Lrp/AsnC family transcriptional regulator [Haloglomus irregulare]